MARSAKLSDAARELLKRVPELENIDVSAAKQSCMIRECDSFRFNDSTVNFVNARNERIRKHLCHDMLANTKTLQHNNNNGTKLEAKKSLPKIYSALNICESPMNFMTHDIMMFDYLPANGSFVMDYMLTTYLHLLYPDNVIPGVLYLKNDDLEPVLFHPSVKRDMSFIGMIPKSFCGMKNIIRQARKSKGNVIVAHVAVYDNPNDSGHSILLLVWKKKDQTTGALSMYASIVDPNITNHENSLFTRLLRSMIKAKSKELDFTYVEEGHLYDFDMIWKFQNIESNYPYASIDVDGYCANWVPFMMEVISRNDARDQYFHKYPTELLRRDTNIPSVPAYWRKLILDYTFSRIVDMYATSMVMKNTKIADFLYKNILEKYLQHVYIGRAFQRIRRSTIDFDIRSLPKMAEFARSPIASDSYTHAAIIPKRKVRNGGNMNRPASDVKRQRIINRK